MSSNTKAQSGCVQAPQLKHNNDTKKKESSHSPSLSHALKYLPGYKITKEIGRGSYGTVFKARRLQDGSKVAIK